MAFEVHVVTPEREVWTGQADQVIAKGVDGDVGILNGHAPMLIRLSVGRLQIQTEDGDWVRAVVDGGFLHVSTEHGDTRVDVLADASQLEDEIDVDAANRRLEELRAGDTDDEAVRIEVAKLEVRVALRSA